MWLWDPRSFSCGCHLYLWIWRIDDGGMDGWMDLTGNSHDGFEIRERTACTVVKWLVESSGDKVEGLIC